MGFDEPLEDNEMETLCRDRKIEAQKDGEYDVATGLMKQFRMVKYQGRVYFYHDTEYIADTDILKRIVFETVGQQKTRYVEEVLKQIDLRTKLIDPEKEFIVKFKNGILKDGQFVEIEYKEFTPYSIDIVYNPDATYNEDVDKYVNHLTNNDKQYRDLLFEILGHTLITNKEVKRLLGRVFIFIGGGGNGKGTLLQIIKKILNTKNVTGLSIKEMTDERYMSSMKGKLANLGDDIQDGVIDDKMMKVLKNISTCDFVATRELYESSESVSFTNSLIFTSNHMIKSFEKGDSWKRRVMWLPMYSTVSEKSKDNRFISKQTSDEALEYWVSQMVQGYMRLYENNRFTDSHLVESENERYHQENNGMLLFLEDYPVDQLLGKRYMEVYTNNYVPWVEENGGNVQSQKAFKEAVMEVYGLDVQPRKVNGKNQRVFVERREQRRLKIGGEHMLSTETLDQIVYIFGLNANTYNLINAQQFIYKGRLVTINDTLPDDNDPDLLRLNISFCNDCLKGNERKYIKALERGNTELIGELGAENDKLMGVIVAATRKLRSQSGEPMTKAEIEKLRVDLRSEHYISGDRNRKTPRQMTQTEVDFMIANSHLSCNLIADELQAMGFDRTRQVVWQKMKALRDSGLIGGNGNGN